MTLPPDGESATVKVRFTANEAGARTFKFKVPTQTGEQVTQNNARDALIQVNDRAEKVLYYEGEPRFEYKFLRAGGRRRQEPAGRVAASGRRRTSTTVRTSAPTTPTS